MGRLTIVCIYVQPRTGPLHMLVLKLIFHFVKPAVKFQPTYKHFQVDFSRFIFTNVLMEHVPEHFFEHISSHYICPNQNLELG